MMPMKYSNTDRYLDPDTGVLKNKLGIRDSTVLEQREADYAAARSYELALQPIKGNFDLAHLCAIHRHLFGDVYAWAGELRDVDIAKDDSFFAHHTYLEAAAHSLFAQLARENHLVGLDPPAFSARVAYYLSEINALHPFRDGNGRAQREFISHLAYENGYFIDWSSISKADLVRASVESFRTGDSSLLADLIRANLHERLKA